MTDIVIKLIIPIICIILSYYIVPLLKNKKIYNAVATAVYAAEQIFSQSGMGKEKFDYVTDYITRKYKISKEDLNNIIESAVYQMKNHI